MSANPFIHFGSEMYGRVYSVVFQPLSGDGCVWGNETKDQSPIRLAFEVERKIVGGNSCKLALTNLARDTRFAIAQGAAFTLRAGYIGQVDTIFLGIAHKIETARQGVEVVTSIELRDAEPFAAQSRFDKGYGPGVYFHQIIQDCAKAMRLPLNQLPVSVKNGVICGLPKFQFAAGFTAEGAVSRTLNTLCKQFDLSWSIQCGNLTIIPKGHYNCREVVLLSAKSGLVNTPGRGANAFTMSSLLNGKLVPGQLVQLDSADTQLSKVYKVIKSTFSGDTHGPQWNVDVEANLYKGDLKPIPIAKKQNFATAVQ